MVEDQLSTLGISLGDSALRTGDIYTPTDTELSLGYERYSVKPYRGIEIKYSRAIVVEPSKPFSLDVFMARVQDESIVYQSMGFVISDESYLLISDDMHGQPEVFGQDKTPSLRSIKESLRQTYAGQYVHNKGTDRYPSVSIQDLFTSALESLKRQP